jgi:hypothetical protein
MKRILDIGHTDLRLFFKHKSAYVWLFVMPLLFVYFMGFGNRGPGKAYNRTPPVLVENADTNFLSRIFLDELNSQNMWLLDPTNRETAARVVRIPADFTSRILQQQQSKVQFLRHDASDEADAALIEVRLLRALIAMNGHLLEAVTATNLPGTLTEAKLRAVMASAEPGELEGKVCGSKTGAVRLQLFTSRNSGDVSDDEPAHLRRGDRGGGAAQRRDQANDGPSGDTPGTGHGKNLRSHAAGRGADFIFPQPSENFSFTSTSARICRRLR